MLLTLVLAVVIVGLAIGLVGLAAGDAKRARDALRAGRLELARYEQRAADENARAETALRLLDLERLARLEDASHMRAEVEGLRMTYDAALAQYRAALMTRPSGSVVKFQ